MQHDRTPLLAVILAGGLSRRMGADKGRTLLNGRPLLDHVAQGLAGQVSNIVVNAPLDAAATTTLPIVPDTIAGHAGPLAGVLAGLRHAERLEPRPRHVLTVPVDTPFLPPDLAQRLLEVRGDDQTVVIASSLDRLHPVVALWPVSLADGLDTWLRDPANRRLQLFLAGHPVVAVDFPSRTLAGHAVDPFMNLNTPAELAAAEAILSETAS